MEISNMETLQKPTIKQLLDAIKLVQDNPDNFNYREDLRDLFDLNTAAIDSNWQNGSHDKEAFEKLIQAIEFNGALHFNMSMFMGSLPDHWWDIYDSAHQVVPFYNNKESDDKKYLDSTTSTFNCDTVGCVAGFATAVAMNWTSEDWLKNFSHFEKNETFANIACNFLNIPLPLAERIFYGENGSIWAFVRRGSESFSDIEFINEEDQYEYDWDELEVNLNSIGHKHAVEVLRMINVGEIQFEAKYGYEPYFTKGEK
jgi:hypothetical protein